MRLVTIRTRDTRVIHFTLQKRPVDIDLLKDLSIGMVEARTQALRREIIQQRSAVLIIWTNRVTTGVATGTLIDVFTTTELFKINDEPHILIRG